MISWVAINRIAERAFTADAKYRKQAAGRPLRLDAQQLTDGELLAKLHSFGIDLDRALLGRLCEETLSAEEIARPWLESRTFKTKREAIEGDWIWICLVALWQRWFPDKPSFEMLDDKMQAGYDRMAAEDPVAACRIWLDAWTDVLRLLDKADIQSIDAFDNRFRGTQSLFNWIQELEDALWNAGLEDREFLNARISVCEEGLRRFETDDDLMTENRRRALAESYFELGETGKAEALYREWLKTDPRWGWGWIGWSDCYRFRFARPELRDLNRSEQLLLAGLSVSEVRDFKDLAERLADLYEEQGRGEEAKELRRQARGSFPQIQPEWEVESGGSIPRQKATLTFGEEGLPLGELPNVAALLGASSPQATVSRQKVGRNEPCPCGSGKKFKKCCGG
jgi:tetratricopeptide (TPR) repeat protein